MRFVDRTAFPISQSLREDMNNELREEWDRVKADPARVPPSRHWTKYKHDGVRGNLKLMFHGKCAYCEGRYIAMTQMDVEHWCPKGLVEEVTDFDNQGRPVKVERAGYWWLAAHYENLFPSCTFCNQTRRQVEYYLEEDGNGVPVEKIRNRTIGKLNFFPLQDDRHHDHWAPPAEFDPDPNKDVTDQFPDLKDQVPLLFNPCQDRDIEIAFKIDAQLGGLLIPAEAPDTAEGRLRMEKAHQSIYGYALNRSGLVFERFELMLDLRERIEAIWGLSKLLENESDPVDRDNISALIHAEMKRLMQACHVSRPYSLVARQIVSRGLAEILGKTEQDILNRIDETEIRSGSRPIH